MPKATPRTPHFCRNKIFFFTFLVLVIFYFFVLLLPPLPLKGNISPFVPRTWSWGVLCFPPFQRLHDSHNDLDRSSEPPTQLSNLPESQYILTSSNSGQLVSLPFLPILNTSQNSKWWLLNVWYSCSVLWGGESTPHHPTTAFDSERVFPCTC